MTKAEFSDLVRFPAKVTSADLEGLEALATSFPYCQIAHILIAKISNQQSNMFAKQKLGKAAAYSLERKKLKSLVAAPSVEKGLPGTVANVKSPDTDIKEKSTGDFLGPQVEGQLQNNTQSVAGLTFTSNQNNKEKTPPTSNTGNTQGEEGSHTEAFSLSPTKKRSSFFEDLERNLQNLRDLKNPLSKIGGIEEIQPIQVTMIGEQPIPQSDLSTQPEAASSADPVNTKDFTGLLNLTTQQPEIPTPLRIEDVVTDAPTSKTGSDIFVEYINFLNDKKSREAKDENIETAQIIDKFLIAEPTIPYLSPEQQEDALEDLSESSTVLPAGIVSENFAEILVRQRKFAKAIQMYEELILKNPAKKSYFVEKIEFLKSKI